MKWHVICNDIATKREIEYAKFRLEYQVFLHYQQSRTLRSCYMDISSKEVQLPYNFSITKDEKFLSWYGYIV